MVIQRPFYQLIKATGIVGLALTMVCSLLFIFGGLAEAAPLQTPISGNITSDTTWTSAGSPYTVTGVVNVQAVLTIEAGVVISFANNAQLVIDLVTGGKLVAAGSAAQPIRFIPANPGMCAWQGLQLKSNNNIIRYAYFEYAEQAIKIEQQSNSNTIEFNTFRHNGGCTGPDPSSGAIIGTTDGTVINYNVFTNNHTAVYLSRSSGNHLEGNIISGTTISALYFAPNLATRSAYNDILSNTIRFSDEYGLYLATGNDNQISYNNIYSNTGGGIRVEDQRGSTYLYDNQIYNNSGPALSVFTLTQPIGSPSIFVERNLLTNNQGGIYWGTGNASGAAHNFVGNVICRTPDYLVENTNSFTLPVTPDWWGDNTPTFGAGADIQGPVNIDPRIIFAAAPFTNTLPADGVSTTVITISLQSSGTTVPAGVRTVNLANSLGTLTPLQVTLNANGIATATLRSAQTIGRAVITATEFCGYPITTTVEFTATDVAINKTAAINQVIPGQTITYTLRYTNTNAAATNITITDTLPTNVTWLTDTAESVGWTRTRTTPQVVWTRPTLAAGDNNAFILVARLSPTAIGQCGQQLTNQVVITTATVDNNSLNNSDSDSSISVICADVGINKTTTLTQVIPGNPVTYTITYNNSGQADAANVVITDTLPANVIWLTDTAQNQGWTRAQTNPPVWTRSTLAASANGSFTLVGQTQLAVGCNTPLTNQAVITSATPDRRLNPKSVSVGGITTICADVSIRKVGPSTVVAGTTITYTLYYSNTGLAGAANVVITDVNSITGGVDTLVNGATLAPGQALSITYPVFVPTSVCANPVITNTGYIRTATPDNSPTNNSSTLTTTVLCHNMVITKALAAPAVSPGKPTVFSITYRNTGFYTAYSVVITDFLAANVVYVTDTITSTGPITWSIGDVGQNQGGVFTTSLQFICPPGATGIYSFPNTARIAANSPDDPAGNESTAYSGNFSCDAVDLVIVKNDNVNWPPPVYAGEVFTYTIVYNNAGGITANSVVITETLPLYTEFVRPTGPSGWTNSPAGSRYYVHYAGDLDPREGGRLDFVVRVAATLPATVTQVNNRVDIASQQSDIYPGDNYSLEQTPVQATPDLVVTKTVISPPVVRPGDVITYRVTLANQGLGAATNIILTDYLPNYTGYLTDTSHMPRQGSNPISWTIASLAPGAPPLSFTLTLTAGANICNVTSITNTIEVDSTEPDRNSSNNRSMVVLPVGCQDVAINKTANTAQVNPGFTVVFTLTAGNPGLAATTQTTVTDSLPGDISFVGSNPPFSSGVGQNYTWTLGPLAVGLTRTIILTGYVSDSAPCGQTLTNTAVITAAYAAGTEPYLGNNTASRAVVVRCIPDLGVLKNDRVGVTSAGEPPFVQAGDVFTYSIYYLNTGVGPASGVVLTETLPYYTDFVGPVNANGWRRVGATRQYTYAVPSPVNASGGGQVTFAVRVTNTLPSFMLGEYITNTVCIGSQSEELTTSDNCSYENTPVTEGIYARLLVTKIANPDSGSVVYAGQPILYDVIVVNTGVQTAYNVRLTDTLPLSHITFITASLSNGQQLYFTNPLTATLGDMPVGRVAVLHVGAIVRSGVTGVFTNTAYAMANNLSAAQASNPVTHTAQTPPLLRVLKTAQPTTGSQVQRGQLITYTLAVTNSGPGSATGVVITDALPLSVTFVSSSTNRGWVSGPNPLVAHIGTLALNQSARFTFTVRVMDTAPAGRVITNAGWLDSDQTIISTTNQVSHTIIAPSLQINKTAVPPSGSVVTPTRRLTYTVVARNNGSAAANTVRITDTLPLTAVNFITAYLNTGGPVYRQGNILTATVASLAGGSQVTMTVVVTVNNVISGTIFTNTASAIANTLPVVGSLPVTHIVTTPSPITSDIRLSKTANLAQTTPGHTVIFTLTYFYSGTTTANNVVITDTLPLSMTFANSAPPPTISDTVRRVYTWTWSSIPAGISQTIVITANAPTGIISGTVLTNNARITTTSLDGNPANNTAAVSIRVVDGIDLFVMKSDGVNSPPASPHVHPGDVITYTISYLNLGNRTASSVQISETLPISTDFVGPSGPGAWQSVGGNYAYIPMGGTVYTSTGGVITFVVRVLTPTLPFITNTVCIAGAQEDVIPGNNCWVVVTPVDITPQVITPTLGLTKTATPAGGSAVQAGRTITYTVVVSNNTGATVNNARITDTLPLTAVNFITATLNTGGPVYRQSNILTAAISSLALGSRLTMTVVVTVNDVITGTIFTNTARASADSWPVVTATVTHILTGTPPITPGLDIVKLANPAAQIHAGQALTYTVIVTNNTGAAANVRITDTLPVAYVTFMGANLSSGGSGIFVTPTLTAMVSITPGGRLTLTILARVNNTAPVGAVFTNTAWASASGWPLVTATVSHRVITNTAVYLPIILRDYTPPSASLAWLDQNEDQVSEVDGSNPSAFTPDGRADGAFALTVNTYGMAKTVTTVTLVSNQSAAWNTSPGDGVIVLGIFNGGSRLNNANGSISQVVNGQAVVTLYASDDLSGSRFPPDTYDYTVYVTFSDGTQVSASARIPPPPPSNCGPYKILRVGVNPRGVVADAAHQRVYVANYGSNSVSVVNTENNTLLQTITGITRANGIAYDAARNIIWATSHTTNQVIPIQANTDATAFTVLPPVAVGSSPWGVAVDSTRNLVYVVNNASNSVTVIDAAARSVIGTVNQAAGQFNQPFHVAVNSDTGKAYVPNFGGPSVTVLEGVTVNKVIPLYDSTQPYGVAVDEVRNTVYVTTVNTHRIIIIGTNQTTGQLDDLLNWAEFHRGWNPGRPVPLRAIAVNATMPSNPPVWEDGGHVWATTSTNDGSESNQALLIPKGGISYFHSPMPCNEVSTHPAEGIAVNPATDRVYVTSGATAGWLTIFTDPEVPPLIYLDVDDNAITVEHAHEK